MLDDLTIHVSEIVTWLPVVISGVALYYSRKALRFQAYLDRKKQIALVNIHIVRDGIKLTNSDNSRLIKAEVRYHHRSL